MKKLLTNNNILILITFFIILYGIIHSVIAEDFIWFARSGSVLVAIGIFMISRFTLVNEEPLLFIGDEKTYENLNSPDFYNKRDMQIPDYVVKDHENKKSIEIYGPFISLLGTLIWGYGDLLNEIVKIHACH